MQLRHISTSVLLFLSVSLSPPTPKKKEEKKEEILIELPRCAYGCCFLKFYVRVFLISKNELGQWNSEHDIKT